MNEHIVKQYNEWAKELHGEFANLNTFNNWESDLKRGLKGEEFILNCYPNKLTKSKDLRWDFDTYNGLKIETKCDFYPSQATNNLFIETISNNTKNSKGGPFISLENGVDYYLYMFNDSKEIYCFKTEELVNRVLELMPNLHLRTVRNKYYDTKGYTIPKDKLIDLNIDLEEIL